jgi:hypothetical protein
MQVPLIDPVLLWLAGFCAIATHSDRVVKSDDEGD